MSNLNMIPSMDELLPELDRRWGVETPNQTAQERDYLRLIKALAVEVKQLDNRVRELEGRIPLP
jgi:hypothetical protein